MVPKQKLNLWYIFLAQWLSFKDWVVSIFSNPKFHVIMIIVLIGLSASIGYRIRYKEVKTDFYWQKYLIESKEQAKREDIDNQVRYIMSMYQCDSLTIYEEIKKTPHPVLTALIIGIESEYNPRAISSCQALGLMQVMHYHFKPGEKWDDPATNIKVGSRIFEEYLKQFDNNVELALSAFNAGPDAVIKAGYKVPTNTKTGETVPYVARGMKIYNQIKSMRYY